MTTSANQPVLALLWRSLGPYHIARAAAAAEHLGREMHIRTVAVELSDQEQTHAWKIDRAAAPVPIKTIAPGAVLDDGAPNLVGATLRVLDELNPKYLAVAGYDRREMRAAAAWGKEHAAVRILMSETKWDDSPRPWWKRAIIRHYVRKFDAGLVSGSAAGEFLVVMGLPRSRIFRQYGAVDNAFFAEVASRARAQNLRPRLDLPGRYFMVSSRLHEPLKNIRHLLLSYERYRAEVTDPWALVICGDGPDRSAYESLVAERRIEGVSFEGFRQLDELALYYARASCFVHPAKREAWGLVVNEAMASALPVIVSRTCGAAYDLVKDGANGLCFDPDQEGALGCAMRQMHALNDEQRNLMGKLSQQMIADWGVKRFASGLGHAIAAVTGRDRGC
jgi:glycosyltransferase involved in cell wall biosynthesis